MKPYSFPSLRYGLKWFDSASMLSEGDIVRKWELPFDLPVGDQLSWVNSDSKLVSHNQPICDSKTLFKHCRSAEHFVAFPRLRDSPQI